MLVIFNLKVIFVLLIVLNSTKSKNTKNNICTINEQSISDMYNLLQSTCHSYNVTRFFLFYQIFQVFSLLASLLKRQD